MAQFKQLGTEGHTITAMDVPNKVKSGTTYFGNRVCPFANRAWIAASETGFDKDMEYVHIELGDEKPAWYQAHVNPFGTVPCLFVDGKPVYESNIVAEYINEKKGGTLMPSDPERRADVRLLIARYGEKCVGPLYQLLRNRDPSKNDSMIEDLRTRYEEFDAMYAKMKANPRGDFLLDSQLSLAEVAFVPFLNRMVPCLEHYRGFNLFKDADIPALERAYNAAAKRPSVAVTLLKPEQGIEFYRLYATGDRAGPLPPSTLQKLFRDPKQIAFGAVLGAGVAYLAIKFAQL
eukprot:TRINITY_DN5838_c0_g1_i2.p1 TRINITY_DN5838_c0_g1~~TRINITY_DN5838_c0_g1_i2.p1  ORF type:complete len:302 (+),score=70.26 TRINITY_DN5838_c0_g1_i2:39-908(+)